MKTNIQPNRKFVAFFGDLRVLPLRSCAANACALRPAPAATAVILHCRIHFGFVEVQFVVSPFFFFTGCSLLVVHQQRNPNIFSPLF